MNITLRPMKAPSESPADLSALKYPLIASPKLDGLRALGTKEGVVSKTLRRFPNEYTHQLFQHAAVYGLDGELIVGIATGDDVIRRTSSGVMSREGTPDVCWHLFDSYLDFGASFQLRQRELCRLQRQLPYEVRRNTLTVEQHSVRTAKELRAYEDTCLAAGYEGVMLRAPHGPYKFGHCTLREGYLLKLKRFTDAEAIVLRLEEGSVNENPVMRRPDGAVQRSTAQEGLRSSGLVGTIVGRDCRSGQTVRIAPGRLTHEERAEYWKYPERIVGSLVTYRYFPTGTVDAPRFPTFQTLRAKETL